MRFLLPKSCDFWQKILAMDPAVEVFAVGGSVRDHLLQRPVKDYDFVVRGWPIQKLIDELAKFGDVDVVGKRFGVVKFRPAGETEFIDIALPRKEYSLSFTGGYRDFDVHSDPHLPLEQDLARRDLTINAMAYDLRTDVIIDPFFGQKDLAAKMIRTVGPATNRFQEDYSRMLRAIRFACTLAFTLSPHIEQTITKLAHHLEDRIDETWVVSRETLSTEFLKAFNAAPLRCLELYDQLGLVALLFPEIAALKSCSQTPPHHTEGSAFDHLKLALKSLHSAAFTRLFSEDLPLLSKLAILFHDIGKPQAATTKDDVIHFYGHEDIGANMVMTICERLYLHRTGYYPFEPRQLAWIIREHLFAIKHQEPTIKRTLLEQMFFNARFPGRSLLHCMLADQLASVGNDHDTDPPIFRLLRQLKTLAPTGELPPPLISGDDVLQWVDRQESPQIAAILDDVRERQLSGALATKAAARAYLEKTYA